VIEKTVVVESIVIIGSGSRRETDAPNPTGGRKTHGL
jgi:hypothetical protein